MKKIFLLHILLLCSLLSVAQGVITSNKISPYTQSFILNMKEQTKSTYKMNALFKNVTRTEKDATTYIHSYIYLTDSNKFASLEELGVIVNSQIEEVITALIPVDMLEAVAALPEVKYVQMGSPVRQRMNFARLKSRVDKVQSGLAPLTMPYLGKDVVVGIIDGGFEYGHPNFYNADHSALRIKRVWNQSKSSGNAPIRFNYGTEYTTESAILNAEKDRADASHGTHVTGIAVGADKSGNNPYYGIAGEADIVLVTQAGTDTNITDAIKYIYDYATSVNKPCVINLSLGTHIGPHDGTSVIDYTADKLQGAGRLLVGAAGNEGNRNIHAAKQFTAKDTELRTLFEIVKDDIIVCDIWGETGTNYTTQICVYDEVNNKILYVSEAGNKSPIVFDNIAPLKGYISGTMSIQKETNPSNKKLNTYISGSNLSVAEGYHIGMIIKASAGKVNAWADDAYCNFNNYEKSDWYAGDNDCSIGEIGGTGKNIISVGAYTSNIYYRNLDGNLMGSRFERPDKISTFSSMGPTADGRIKPDVCAPGSIIVSSISNYDNKYYDEDKIRKTTVAGKAYYYGIMQGTSMASPFVTGVLATWLQANPKLTPDNVKEMLNTTSINDTYTGEVRGTGSNTWGAGKIDAYSGILGVIEALKKAKEEELFSQKEVILFYPSPNDLSKLNLFFVTPDSNVTINIYNVNGQMMNSQFYSSINSKQEEVIDLQNYSRGVYIIKISGNKINKTIKVVR